jgi:hypothetical protein
MTDSLRKKIVGVIMKHRRHLGAECIIYRRDQRFVKIWSIPRVPTTELTGSDNDIVLTHVDMRWTLPLGGLCSENPDFIPRPGDIIERLKCGRNEIYEVLPIDAEECWTSCDEDLTMINVNTKRIG